MAFTKTYIPAISHTIFSGTWYDPALAYDNNTVTFAHGEGSIEFNAPSGGIEGTHIKFFIDSQGSNIHADVYVFYDGILHLVYTVGDDDRGHWIEVQIAITPKVMTKVKFDECVTGTYDFRINEIQFHDIWPAPGSHSDPGDCWTWDVNAYDRNENTYASGNLVDEAGKAIVFDIPANFSGDSNAVKVRGAADDAGNPCDVQVDIYDGSNWTTVLEHTFIEVETIEVLFTAQIVTKARVWVPNGETFDLHEFWFCNEYPAEAEAEVKKHHGNLCEVLSDDSKAEL